MDKNQFHQEIPSFEVFMQQHNPTTYDCLIAGGYEFIQATPIEDGRFEVVMTKNGRTVTLLTDEPFRGSEECDQKNKANSSLIKQALAVAIVQQYEQTPKDISASFTLDELSEVVKVAQPLIVRKITELKATISTMRGYLDDFLSLANGSDGVVGYHRNGVVANWSEFDFVSAAANILSDTSGNYYAKRNAEMFEAGYIAGWISRDNENGEDYTAEESYAEFVYEAARS